MAKLTKAQRQAIESVLASVNRAIAFIENDRIAICTAREINAAVEHYGTGESGHTYRAASPYRSQDYKGRDDSEWSIDWIRELTPIAKGTGSDLIN